MGIHNSNGIESVKEVSPTPAQPKYVFGNAPDIFHVEVDKNYQSLDEQGRVKSGKVLRWANVGEGNEHREEVLSREYWTPCTSPDVKTPFAYNVTKDGTCNGAVPLIKRYGETYKLMERPLEASQAQFSYERRDGKERLMAANTHKTADGIKPEWTLTPDKRKKMGR